MVDTNHDSILFNLNNRAFSITPWCRINTLETYFIFCSFIVGFCQPNSEGTQDDYEDKKSSNMNFYRFCSEETDGRVRLIKCLNKGLYGFQFFECSSY